MAEIIQDLKLQNDPTTIVRPNIVTGSIPSGAVTGDKIADGAITTSKVNDGAITSDKIAPASVIGGKLGVSSVYDLNIASGAVNEYKLASNAVVTSKIANGAVTNGKIATATITGDKIATATITGDKIANQTISNNKLKFVDNYIIDEDLGDDIDEFVVMFTLLFKKGFRFYFDDENGYIAQVDSIEIGPHSVTLYSKYPLQGMQDEQIIDSSNFSTYFVSGGNGTLLHYCGA